MNYEILKALYVIDKDILKPKINLRRVTTGGVSGAFERNERFYFAYNRRNILFYLSVTSFCKQVLPFNPFLLEWYVEQGKEGVETVLKHSSAYGSIMHDILLTYLRDGAITANEIFHMLQVQMKEYNIHHSLYNDWKNDIISDFLAFAAWVQEYNIRPVAIEYPVASNKMKLGGLIDLVCTATIPVKDYHGEVYVQGPNKGQPKETIMKLDKTIIVDLKSGRKNFYDAHKLQLDIYKRIWNENFGKLVPVESVYNWSPTDWRAKPGFNFSCQDNEFSDDSVKNYLDRIRIENMAQPGMTFKSLLDETMSIDKMPEFIVLNLADHIRAKNDIIY